jgi:hypothetical protein
MIEYLLIKVVSVVATVAVPTLTFMGTKYINRRWKLDLSQKEEEQVFELAKKSVMFSSQKFSDAPPGDARNRDKLKEAIRYLVGEASRMGIKLNEVEAEKKIESAINKIKRERGLLTSPSSGDTPLPSSGDTPLPPTSKKEGLSKKKTPPSTEGESMS